MNVRLSVFWFLYMAGLGIFFPYYSLYLRQHVGLSESRVGLVMAMIPLVGLLTQPLWGHVADRTGSRRGTLALAIGLVAIAYGALGSIHAFGTAVLGTCFLAVSLTAVLPMAMAVTLAAQFRHGASAFGYVRMWGTLGFLFSVVTFPRYLERLERLDGPWRDLSWMFPAAAAWSILAVAAALRLPRTHSMTVRSRPGDARRLFGHAPVVRALVLVFFAHLCMQGPINLFPLFVTSRGGDAASIGSMWVFMLLLEIPLIGFSGPTLRRFGARTLLTVGLLAEGVRWSVSAASQDLELIRWMQLLHGVGVAGVIVGGPLYVEQSVPERLRSTGQTLVSTIGFGLGAIVSISLGGWLVETVGASTPYRLAGAGALVLGVLVYRLLPEPTRPDETDTSETETSAPEATGERHGAA